MKTANLKSHLWCRRVGGLFPIMRRRIEEVSFTDDGALDIRLVGGLFKMNVKKFIGGDFQWTMASSDGTRIKFSGGVVYANRDCRCGRSFIDISIRVSSDVTVTPAE